MLTALCLLGVSTVLLNSEYLCRLLAALLISRADALRVSRRQFRRSWRRRRSALLPAAPKGAQK